MTGWLGWLGRRSIQARLGLVAAVGGILAAVALFGADLAPAPSSRQPATSSTTDDQIPWLVFPMTVGDQTKIDVAATGPARQRLARGIGLLWKLGFDFPAGNRSRFGLLITVHDCQSMPGECGDVRADIEQARAYPQLEYGACTVIVDEAAVAATAGQLRVATDRWFAAVLAHELTHCDGQKREDVAETRGTLWVGRQLGDRHIVQDALNAIQYDIDEDGHWKSRAAATSTIGLTPTRWTRSKVAGSSQAGVALAKAVTPKTLIPLLSSRRSRRLLET
jgi:hypothetical protein